MLLFGGFAFLSIKAYKYIERKMNEPEQNQDDNENELGV